ncbi:hypothetical protein ACN6LC_006516 [Streptomyces violaceoruber]|nr:MULTISPECIES: hypothetical protein [Streptomyces]BDE39897.1 hypothetical protein SLITK23_31420 [Streptomyces lividans]EFD68771.1 conserved hypothetical protein [Streptomyces lividans TK24]EOY48196.1 putative membrane protein [Streptomyces lividans 1326]KKD15132.1 membrane protein [Streptomyces sp. WM6391]MDX2924788.1 hypothetical protein [Streptomyces sp. NRRL_B-16638]
MPASAAAARPRQASSVSSVLLRFGRVASMGTVTALILIAGVWASWGTAQHVLLTKGREQGTVEVTRCGGGTCSGPYSPVSAGSQARERVVLEDSVAVAKGRTYSVVLKPGSADAVRSGPAGVLYAWVPLGGALLLASVVVAGGLRRTRAGWVMAGAGVALLTAAFVAV